MENKYKDRIINMELEKISKGSTFTVYKDNEGNIYKKFSPNIFGVDLDLNSNNPIINNLIKGYKDSFLSSYKIPDILYNSYKEENLTSLINKPIQINDWLIYNYNGGVIFDNKYKVFDIDKDLKNLLGIIKSLILNVKKFHQNKLVVLDIAPANILNIFIDTKNDNIARIIDFGSVRSTSEIKKALDSDDLLSIFMSTQKYYDKDRFFDIVSNYKNTKDDNYLENELFRLDAIAIIKLLIFTISNSLHIENKYNEEEELYLLLKDKFFDKIIPVNNRYQHSFFKYYYIYYLLSKMIWYVFENRFYGIDNLIDIIDDIILIIDNNLAKNNKIIKMYNTFSLKEDIIFGVLEEYTEKNLVGIIKDSYKYYRPKKPFDLYYYLMFNIRNSYVDTRIIPNINSKLIPDMIIDYFYLKIPNLKYLNDGCMKLGKYLIPNINWDYSYIIDALINNKNLFFTGKAGIGKSSILLLLESILLKGGSTCKYIKCNMLDIKNIDKEFEKGYDYYFIDGLDEFLIKDSNILSEKINSLESTIVLSSREYERMYNIDSINIELKPLDKGEIENIIFDDDIGILDELNDRGYELLSNTFVLKMFMRYYDNKVYEHYRNFYNKIYKNIEIISEDLLIKLLNMNFIELYKYSNRNTLPKDYILNEYEYLDIYNSISLIGEVIFNFIYLDTKSNITIPEFLRKIFYSYDGRIFGVHKFYENFAIAVYLLKDLNKEKNIFDKKYMKSFLKKIVCLNQYDIYSDSLFYIGQLLMIAKKEDSNLVFIDKYKDIIEFLKKLHNVIPYDLEPNASDWYFFVEKINEDFKIDKVSKSLKRSMISAGKVMNFIKYNSVLAIIYLGYNNCILDDGIWTKNGFMEAINDIPSNDKKYYFLRYINENKTN